jgi:hypothetical protein
VAYAIMSDRKALARAIAARSKARFIEIKPEPRSKASRSGRVVEIPRERRGGVPFTEEELSAIRGGRTAEEYRLHLISTYLRE